MNKVSQMADRAWETLKIRFTEAYLYYVQGIEIGSRIERRMERFQHKFERMMKRRGIALIVSKTSDDKVTLGFVPQKEFDVQKKMVNDLIAQEGEKLDKEEIANDD